MRTPFSARNSEAVVTCEKDVRPMKNERGIFEAAIEIDTATQREAYLVQACGGDAELLSRIRVLLDEHNRTSDFLTTPVMQQSSASPTLTGDPLTWDNNTTLDFAPETKDFEDVSDADDAEFELNYLSPPSRPNSLGSLGHYEILEVLGHGGFGTVFKAFDEKLHRTVAIKVMSPTLAVTSPPRKRFLREARSAAAIKHENVVQVYAVEEQPLPYLVMEFVEGETLQQFMGRSGPVDAATVVRLARQIASGLEAAHSQGLIHRDIKPGNILVEGGPDARIKLTDFGLARSVDDASMTRTGIVSGTPMYMAPEQAQGQAMDQRTDLFSLGSVLYQMACGRPPFRGQTSLVVLKRVIEDSPRPIQEVLSEIPDWLAGIIHRLLEKKPENRIQTSAELVKLLSRCESELNIQGKLSDRTIREVLQPVASPNVRPRISMARAIAAFCVVSLLLLSLYLVQQFWPSVKARTPDATLEPQDNIAHSPVTNGVPNHSPTAESRLDQEKPGSLLQIMDMSRPWNRFENLGGSVNSPQREANPIATNDELTLLLTINNELYQASRSKRGEEFTNKRKLQGTFASRTTTSPWYCMTGDGLELVFNSQEGASHDVIYVCRRNTLQAEFSTPTVLPGINVTQLVRHPVISPNGLWLAVTVGGDKQTQSKICIYHRNSRSETFELSIDPALTPQGSWDVVDYISNDGKSILLTVNSSKSRNVFVAERNHTKEKFQLMKVFPPQLQETKMDSPWISADGKSIYFHSRELSGGHGNLDIWVAHRD